MTWGADKSALSCGKEIRLRRGDERVTVNHTFKGPISYHRPCYERQIAEGKAG